MNSALFVALACALVAAAGAVNPDFDADWQLFKTTHNKQYQTKSHEAVRRDIWETNLARINKHNLRFKLGQESYQVGMNHLGDLTTAEMKRMLNGYKPQNSSAARELYVPTPGFVADKTVDWRTKGVVTPVKNQGQCGSCWAFSATGSLEGQHALKTKKLVSLSEQELVDCSGDEGNEGCSGGWMDQAFEYVLKNKGIDTEESYPYEAEDGDCRAKTDTIGATLVGHVDVKEKDEADLEKAIAEIGPISVAIDASQFGFQFYKSGVYYSEDCSEDQLDHGVLAVGYGDNGGANGKYYIVKNSWAETWGDKGYLKMSRRRDNNCGIASKASYPKV